MTIDGDFALMDRRHRRPFLPVPLLSKNSSLFSLVIPVI